MSAAQSIDTFMDVDFIMAMGMYIVNNYVCSTYYPRSQKANQMKVYRLMWMFMQWSSYVAWVSGLNTRGWWETYKAVLEVLIVKSSGNYNYAVNITVLQYKLSDRQAAQLMWSRTINTKGRQGSNIPITHGRQLKGVLCGCQYQAKHH